MTTEESQTVSQALLNLGRIGSVEGPIRAGFLGFYKAQKLMSAGKEIPEDVRYQLNRWREFCGRFVVIVELENKEVELEKWLSQKPNDGQSIASRTETYEAVYSLFSDDEERRKWIPKMESLRKKTEAVLKNKAKAEEIKSALNVLSKLQDRAAECLIDEKRISEKILSGRATLR